MISMNDCTVSIYTTCRFLLGLHGDTETHELARADMGSKHGEHEVFSVWESISLDFPGCGFTVPIAPRRKSHNRQASQSIGLSSRSVCVCLSYSPGGRVFKWENASASRCAAWYNSGISFSRYLIRLPSACENLIRLVFLHSSFLGNRRVKVCFLVAIGSSRPLEAGTTSSFFGRKMRGA